MATLPAWDALTKIVCSGCGQVLYPVEPATVDTVSEVKDIYGDSNQVTVTVTWTQIARHYRRDCSNPAEFGATVTYEKES